MTVPPLDIDNLDTFKRARLAAESLDKATISTEVHNLGDGMNDLVAGLGALGSVIAWIEEGKGDDLLPAARFITQRLDYLATDLLNDHVEISNKLHYWAEKEEPKP
jgi:hypothetical protein